MERQTQEELLASPDSVAITDAKKSLFEKINEWFGRFSLAQRVSVGVLVFSILVLPVAISTSQQAFRVRSFAAVPVTAPGSSNPTGPCTASFGSSCGYLRKQGCPDGIVSCAKSLSCDRDNNTSNGITFPDEGQTGRCVVSLPSPTSHITVTNPKPTGNITPTPINRAPVFSVLPKSTARVGDKYFSLVKGYDLDTSDTLSIISSGLPSGITLRNCVTSIVRSEPANRKYIGCELAGTLRSKEVVKYTLTLKDNRGKATVRPMVLVIN